MTEINEKINQAVINDDFDKIESIALNPKNALVRVSCFNIFTGKLHYEQKWVDVSNVINQEDYFEDLTGECQDYVMQLDKYKNMDYDKMIEEYDRPTEKKNNKRLEQFKKAIEKRVKTA